MAVADKNQVTPMTKTTCVAPPESACTSGPATDGDKGAGPSLAPRQLARRRHGMTNNKLPPGCKSISAAAGELRRALEQALVDARGEVTLMESAHLNTAMRFEIFGQLALKQLRQHWAELPPLDRVRLAEQHAKASESRDKAIERLRLPTGDNQWNPSDLYRLPLSTIVQDATGSPLEASAPEPPQNTTEPPGTPPRAGEKNLGGI